tara:strand:+ start:2290 stop:2991 length:702 start_codon:yes stop_codon:yes gene_type:complete
MSLSVIGGVIGGLFGYPGIGAGIGSLLGGGKPQDAIKAAALGGISGALVGGKGLTSLLGAGTGQIATQEATKEAASKGLPGIFKSAFTGDKAYGNILQALGLGMTAYGVANPPDPLAEAKKLDDYLSDQWDSIEVETPDYESYYDDLNRQYAAAGGLIQGPGTGTSDDIPAMIYQNGQPVREAALSNGEVVFSLKDLEQLGGGNAELAGQIIGNAPNGSRGQAAAMLYRSLRA